MYFLLDMIAQTFASSSLTVVVVFSYSIGLLEAVGKNKKRMELETMLLNMYIQG